MGPGVRHATKAMREAGCTCDGCRLSGLIAPQRTVNKVDAAPFRYVIQCAIAGGFTLSSIAQTSGVSRQELGRIWYGQEAIQRRTAAKLRVGLLSLIPEGGGA